MRDEKREKIGTYEKDPFSTEIKLSNLVFSSVKTKNVPRVQLHERLSKHPRLRLRQIFLFRD